MNCRTLLYFLVVMTGTYQGSLKAATIYKWVDENDLTHFSGEPPAAATSVVRFEIDPNGYAKSSALQESDRFHSIANQWKRINQQRLQRQQLTLHQAGLKGSLAADRISARYVFDQRANRNIMVYSRRVYRRHGYYNGRHYLHSYRPGGKPYVSSPRLNGFP